MNSKENGKVEMKNEKNLIAGVEGGATRSKLIVMDDNGNKLTEVDGPGTNHWLLGMKEAACRINNMIVDAKRDLQLSENVPFHCVGLSLSGCGEEKTNNELIETLLDNYPKASKKYIVDSDTIGSLRTGLSSGGIVLIAGTGSNALLINPDGETVGCGGWGHRIGDEGSAFWIAQRACKYIFDHLDGLEYAPHPITFVHKTILKYFNVNELRELLPYFYTNFDKSKFAMLTKELVAGCEKGDLLCLAIFEEAGKMLAKHIEAVSQKAHNDLKEAPGGLKIICVGSVWKSWVYLKNGFTGQIQKSRIVDKLSLLRLTTSAAVGACYLAAEKMDMSNVKKTYDTNTSLFYYYDRDNDNNEIFVNRIYCH